MQSETQEEERSDRRRYFLAALPFESALCDLLTRLTRDRSVVPDLLQDTYCKLLELGTQDRPEIRSIRAFALSVARNVAFDWLRRGKIVQFDAVADMDALDVNDERPAPDEIVSGEQEFERLVQAVEALPEARRQVFELRKVYGFSVREISVKLDMAERTVERHLQEAIRTLAQLLYGRVEERCENTPTTASPSPRTWNTNERED